MPRFTFLLCLSRRRQEKAGGGRRRREEAGYALHNLWHLARFVIRQIEMLFICGTCAPAQPEADDDKCENVDDVHGLSPGVALTVCLPLPLPHPLPSPLAQSALSADLFLAVFLFVIRFLRVYKLNASSCAASALLATSWLPLPSAPSFLPTQPSPLAHSNWLVAICLANCANCSRRDNLIKHISLPPPCPLPLFPPAPLPG